MPDRYPPTPSLLQLSPSLGVARSTTGRLAMAHDKGGFLPCGVTTVINDTGEPIPVLTSEQAEHSRRYIHDTYGDDKPEDGGN
jgi:hypothetical protein